MGFATSGAANGDNLFLLSDINGDGDYMDEGETGIFLSRLDNGANPDRPRAVAAYQAPATVPLPASSPLLALTFGALSFAAKRKQA